MVSLSVGVVFVGALFTLVGVGLGAISVYLMHEFTPRRLKVRVRVSRSEPD